MKLPIWDLRFTSRTQGDESGAEATAVQTLRECLALASCAKRLDCGAFTAAFGEPIVMKYK